MSVSSLQFTFYSDIFKMIIKYSRAADVKPSFLYFQNVVLSRLHRSHGTDTNQVFIINLLLHHSVTFNIVSIDHECFHLPSNVVFILV